MRRGRPPTKATLLRQQHGGTLRKWERLSTVMRWGVPELVAMVIEQQSVKLGPADDITKLQPDVQRWICAQGAAAVRNYSALLRRRLIGPKVTVAELVAQREREEEIARLRLREAISSVIHLPYSD